MRINKIVWIITALLFINVAFALTPPNANATNYYNFNQNVVEQWFSIFNGTITEATYNLSTYPSFNIYGNGANASMKFDGINDIVDIGDIGDFSDFTISTWIKKNTTGMTTSNFIGNQEAGPTRLIRLGFEYTVADFPTVGIEFDNSNWKFVKTNVTKITDSNWHHFLTTRKNDIIEIWIDGVNNSINTYSSGGSMISKIIPTGNFQIGGILGASQYFNGSIDEVQIFNRTLTNTEIVNLYNFGSILGSINQFSFNGTSIPANNTDYIQLYMNFSQKAYLTNNTMNCSLILNGILNETKTYENLSNELYSFNINYSKTLNATGLYNYFISCKSLIDNTTTNTTTTYFNLISNTINETYTNLTIELNTESFNLNFTTLSNIINITAKLNYNNTEYTPTQNGFNFNYSLSIPFVSINNTQYSFFWNYTIFYNNGSNETLNTSSKNQTIAWKVYNPYIAFRVYNNISGILVSNFSTNASNTTQNYYNLTSDGLGLLNIPMNIHQNKTFNVTVNSSTFNNTFKKEFNFSYDTYLLYNISMFIISRTNLTFLDLETGGRVNNVNVNFVSDIYASNQTLSNNSIVNLPFPNSYIINYQSSGYTISSYVYNVPESSSSLTLYLTKNTSISTVTATVYDQNYKILTGAYIKVLKYDVTTNSYIYQDIQYTNFQGQAVLNLILYNQYYKFILEYPYGTIETTTAPAFITTNTLTFQINTDEEPALDYNKNLNLNHDLYFNTVTNNFVFTYSDTTNTVTQGCLKIYKVGVTQDLINNTCVSGIAGSIVLNVANTSGTSYIAKGYVYYDSTETFIESLMHQFRSISMGKEGIFLTFLLTILFMSIGYYNITIALLITPIPLILMSYLDFINFSIGLGLLIEAAFVVMAVMISRK